MRRVAPASTLFPYTTLFRSRSRIQRLLLPTLLTGETQPEKTGGRAEPTGARTRNLGAGLSTHYGPSLLLLRIDRDRKSTRLNSSHLGISYAVFCLKKKTKNT